MRVLNKNSKLVLVLTLLFLSLYNVSGQDSHIKNRINFKISNSKYKEMPVTIDNNTVSNLRIETNYGILNLIEVGIYFGASLFNFVDLDDAHEVGNVQSYLIPFYGINTNMHILPIFIKAKDFRFDFYIAMKYGGMYVPHLNSYYHGGNKSEYGIGPGLSFYLWKHIGVYAEYCAGKYYYENNKNLRFGISLKF